MNKFKKLAVAAVSVVMAGTMAFSFTACGKKDKKDPDDEIFNEAPDKYGILNSDGSINYNTYKNRGQVTLNVAIGYEGLETSISYQVSGAGAVTLPDENTYTYGSMKPMWVQMGSDLNIKWNDVYTGAKTADNIKALRDNNKYATTDIYTTDLSQAVSYAASGTSILNLAKYLNRMPNFKKFLKENGVVYLSLLQDGMDTTTGSGQEILVAPYFDGMNDIERYCIIRHDWAKKLLNGSTAGRTDENFASACTAVSASSFMGSTDYTVDSLTADGNSTQKIKKNYTAAAAAAKDDSKPLGAAYKAIAGSAYNKNSGNIIDIMNEALNANANATGAQLLDLFRAYIDVAFTKEDGSSAYSENNRADMFIGYDACWDVDDLVAMLRCIMTNKKVLNSSGKIAGITPRDSTNSRTPDIISLACQLYGVRGGTSRNEYTYITSNGTLKDARNSKEFYQAAEKMNALLKEGLIANYASSTFKTESGIGTGTGSNNKDYEYFMVYDYSQTQTLYGFQNYSEGVLTNVDLSSGYDFEPILTPVSKWDVDGNGTIAANEYFRFTESWRSTKTGGLAVNGDVEKDEKKLEAALEFIDYLYSEDGQILNTFGPMADADGKGGFWHNEVASATDTDTFTYKGVKYKGTEYKDRYTPTLTADVIKSFKGLSVHDWKTGLGGATLSKAELNFTNYARYLIGSTLPMGVKDQSFENQLTSTMGKTGADKVGRALKLDVVKGMSLEIDKTKANYWWFTCVPTGLPIDSDSQAVLDDHGGVQDKFMNLTGTVSDTGSGKDYFSIMNWIVLTGTSGKYGYASLDISYTSIDNLLEQPIVVGGTAIKSLANIREANLNKAWGTAKNYWTYLEAALAK